MLVSSHGPISIDAYCDYRKVEGIRNDDDPELKKGGLMDKVQGVHGGLSHRIPQQHKHPAADHFNRGEHFLSAPAEHRDQFIYSGKKVY
jgi:hypothetical protein